MSWAETDWVLIEAAGRGDFTYDDGHVHVYRLHDRPVEYDLYSRLNNLVCDGLLDDPQVDGQPLKVTDAGWAALK
jgi:hypothetical protein